MLVDETLSPSSQNLGCSFLLVLEQEYFKQKYHLLVGFCLFVGFNEVYNPVLVWKFVDYLFVSLVECVNYCI